jgi:hypothetical protein
MLRLRHWPSLMVALLVCLAVLGCGSSGGTPGSNGSAQANGAPGGAPNGGGGGGGGGGAGAPGAPIKIPDIVQSQGADVSDVINSLENGTPLPTETNGYNGIIAQCGGQLCVTIKAKPGSGDYANSHNQCIAIGETDPPARSVVHPGDTIWVLTGTQPPAQPCGSGQSPSGGDQSPSGGDQSPVGSSS